MKENRGEILYRPLHAPKSSGALLVAPPIREFATQVRAFFNAPPAARRVCWGAESLAGHRAEARAELQSLLKPLAPMDAPLVFVGHQPQLFHPGVWVKNFITGHLANLVGGHAINLIVDNDVMKSASITVPSREREGATLPIAFDDLAEEMPFEERPILDPHRARSFAERVAAVMPPMPSPPLLANAWPKAIDQAHASANWGLRFSACRSQVEQEWGLNLVDVPLSELINTQAFARLVLEIICDAHAFAETYNACLADYRKVNRLRSRSHPAPDLEIVSETEVELPFWLWTKRVPHRKRAFVRRDGNRFTVTDREQLSWSGYFSESEQLLNLVKTHLLSRGEEPSQIKLRPKALITTLYARLLLCDGFVHGIGGAKYDQVTEAISARWGLGDLAPMQCATMTLRLPLPMTAVTAEEVRHKKRLLRELTYHPEKHLAAVELTPQQLAHALQLAHDKLAWIARIEPESLRERHLKINEINAELAALLAPLRKQCEEAFQAAQAQFNSQQPWLSREFAALLFPADQLRTEFARACVE